MAKPTAVTMYQMEEEMAYKGFEIETRGDDENYVIPLAFHNASTTHTGQTPVGPDDWFGVILADHGLVATFCTSDLAAQFLASATA